MNYVLIFNLIFSLITFAFGIFVYLKRKESSSLVFFFLCLFASIWAIGIASFTYPILFSGKMGLRIAFFGASFLTATLLYFVQLFPKEKYLSKKINFLFVGSLALIGIISIFSSLIVKNIEYRDTTVIHKEYGPLYPIFGILFLLTLILSLVISFRKYKTLEGLIKKQSGYLFAGLFISFVLATITNLICPLFKIGPPYISQYGPLSLIFFIGFTTLAITRYHLFEIKVILTELLVGLMGIILLVLPFLMPTSTLKILTFVIFLLFCIFGYYLVKATHEESKRREEAERVAKEFERLNRIMTQFLLATQHHLRTPLTAIQGYLSMIYEGSYGEISPKVKSKIKGTLESAQNLIRVVNEFLDVAQFQAGKGEIEKKETDFEKEVLLPTIEGLKPEAEKKGLKFIFEIEKNLPKIFVDSQKIKIAIFNVLHNAIKYTEKGWIKLSAELIDGGKKILIKISDSGIGLTEEEKKYLFQFFFERGERARWMYGPGRGIGLFLSSEIIRVHGGKIWVESEGIGKGSAFYIELPV